MAAVEDSIQKVPASVVKKLESAIGKENVKTSKFERLLYSHDLAPLPKETQLAFKNVPDIVVKPCSTEDVQKIVKIAAESGMPITPRGSSTWGLGGSIPAFGGILIDMSGSMNKIIKIDKENLCVTAQAGATWKDVYDACLKEDMLLRSYPSSYPSATLAGWISTSGIGIGGYKYGAAGDEIRNMKVVMPDGKIIDTGFDLVCDNLSGYNFNRLFTGAEGTLGVIAEVTFLLEPGPEVMRSLAYELDSVEAMGEPLMEICRSRAIPLHIQFYDGAHFDMLRKAGKHAPDVKSLLTFQLEGDKTIVDWEEQTLDSILIDKFGAKKLDTEFAEHEWEERSYEFRAREMGLAHIPGEVVVPVKEFSAFSKVCYELLDELKMQGGMTGMLADRNTVMFMPYYFFDSTNILSLTSFSYNKKLADEAMKHGGRSCGFGMFFASSLKTIRGDGADYMKKIKDALDPKDIMNPGTLLATVTRQNITIPSQLFNMGMDLMGVAKKMIPREDVVGEKATEYEVEREKRKGHEGR
jgi:glycolate oxidase